MKKWIARIVVQIFLAACSGIGAAWSVLEIAKHYAGDHVKLQTILDNVFILLFAAIVGAFVKLCQIYRDSRLRYKIENTTIIVEPGNILRRPKGVIVVGTNRQLETGLNQIAKNSIQYQLVKKYGENAFKPCFDAWKEEKRKCESEGRRWQTWRTVEVKGREYLFIAMSDLAGPGAASTNPGMLRETLGELFASQQRLALPDKRMYMPVLGTGAGGMRLSHQETIKEILKSYLDFCLNTTEDTVSKIQELHIKAYWKDMSMIDWPELNIWLRVQRDYCAGCRRASQ